MKYYPLNQNSFDFSQITGTFSFFISTLSPARITVANRIGGELNIGDLSFYNGATIGRASVRGYRRSRFRGDAAFYHNLDLRLRLFYLRNYLLPSTLGILAFHDVGRVWLVGENSNTWHSGKGFGVWIAPLNQMAVTFSLAFGEGEILPIVNFGYHF